MGGAGTGKDSLASFLPGSTCELGQGRCLSVSNIMRLDGVNISKHDGHSSSVSGNSEGPGAVGIHFKE